MPKWLIIFLLLFGLLEPVRAEPCIPGETWAVEPDEKDTGDVVFAGRTLNATPTPGVTVTLVQKKTTDTTPANLVTSATISGSTVRVQVNPNNACPTPTGTPGTGVNCRLGNTYQVRVQPQDDSGNLPTKSWCVQVKRDLLTVQP